MKNHKVQQTLSLDPIYFVDNFHIKENNERIHTAWLLFLEWYPNDYFWE